MTDIGRVAEATISASEALTVVASFFGDEWRETRPEEVSVTKFSNGYSSTVHLVTRSSAGDREPRKVILRNILSNLAETEPVMIMSVAEQAIVFYEMSRRGWGPKLYGINRDYRVEEFIESHHLTPAEASDPFIRSQVARAYAHLHSLQMPFVKQKIDLWLEDLKEAARIVRRSQSTLEPLIRSLNHPDAGFVADNLFKTDFESAYEAIKCLAKEKNFKRGYCQTDTQFLNMLVRNEVGESHNIIVPIDYEMGMNSYRAFDIGSHFVCRMWRANTKDKLTGRPFPSLEERTAFCQEYLKALVDMGQQLNGDDSVERMLFESDIGVLVYTGFTCNAFFRHAKIVDVVVKEPAFLQVVRFKLELFLKLRHLLDK